MELQVLLISLRIKNWPCTYAGQQATKRACRIVLARVHLNLTSPSLSFLACSIELVLCSIHRTPSGERVPLRG